MRDDVYLGAVPCDETCEQVGTASYDPIRARLECRTLIGQIRRERGPEPEGAALRVKSNPHDFGTYLEVVCSYDDDNQAAAEYAYGCEAHYPQTWDAEARAVLGLEEER